MLQCKKYKKEIIGNIFELGRGRIISQEEINLSPGIYPVYSSQSFNNGEMGKISTFDFEGEYITWTTDGAYAGTVFYRNGKFNCTNVCGTLKAIKQHEISIKYFSYLLGENTKKYVSYVGNPKLMNGVVYGIPILYIKGKENQTYIANILSTCDEVIEKTEETIGKYKQIKAGMMQDLFTRGLDENGKLRPKYEQSPDLYKYSEELGRYIPKEWEVKTFNKLIEEDILDSIQDGNHGEKHPKASDFVATGIPFIMANNITKDGHVDLKNCNFITYEQYKSLRIGFATENDVLLTHKGTVGLTAIIPSGVKDVMLTPQVTYYRIKDLLRLDKHYLYTYFQSPMFQNIIQGLSEQSTRAYIGITKQAELNCIYMNIKEQKNIGKVVAKINDKLQFEQAILSKYKQIKQGLMKRLLTPPADAEIVEE